MNVIKELFRGIGEYQALLQSRREMIKYEKARPLLATGLSDGARYALYACLCEDTADDCGKPALIICGDEKEALKITDTVNPDDALNVLSRFFEKPIVKLDRDGVVGLENGRRVFVKSIDEYKNVDSTGAGDAFLAGFSFGLYYDYPFEDCLLFGNITGGKCVTKAGALSAFVNKEELLKKAEENR